METAKTGLELVEFCKQQKIFQDWSPVQLISNLHRAIAENTLIYSVNELGQIDGICIGQTKPGNVMHIAGIVCSRGVMMRVFYPIFKQRYPGWTLSGYRDNVFKTYKL